MSALEWILVWMIVLVVSLWLNKRFWDSQDHRQDPAQKLRGCDK